MSAKQVQVEPAKKCVCGETPGMHKTLAGHTTIYSLACEPCGIKTATTDRLDDAVGEWNELIEKEISRRGNNAAVAPEVDPASESMAGDTTRRLA